MISHIDPRKAEFEKFIEALIETIKAKMIITEEGNSRGTVRIPIEFIHERFPSLFECGWFYREDIFDECKRIFFRLSQKPDASLIPLWDLIDERPVWIAEYEVNRHNNASIPIKVVVYRMLKYLFQETCKKTPCPIEYDSINAVFTKEQETFSFIKILESSFREWDQNVLQKNGKK